MVGLSGVFVGIGQSPCDPSTRRRSPAHRASTIGGVLWHDSTQLQRGVGTSHNHEDPTRTCERPIHSTMGHVIMETALSRRRFLETATVAAVAAEAFADERLRPALQANWPLVPVPLHRTRLQHRNFNQAAEIARVVARHTALPVLPALKRIRRTDTQALLGRKARLHNLRGAFALTSAGRRHLATATGAGAILIDDVLTTGSTVEACAATLRHAGFKSVLVVTVMRG